MKHIRIETINMKGHTELNEAWVQQVVADDPTILGLGDLVLRDKERRQPKGRLDLVLEDAELEKRYEVEVQLGETDETHIIRTIEYWDVEQKRYPQYDHCAVIVAEDVTSRFLNVIGLFNGQIPLIALQMTAIKLDGGVGLKFTRVVDEITRGPNDVDDGGAEVVGRDYWVKRSSEQVLQLADQVLAVVKEFDPTLSLKYNKHYIGIAKDGVARNFIWLGPARSHLRLNISLPKDDTIIAELDKSGLNLMGYKWGAYRIRLSQSDDVGHSELIKTLLKKSYESF